MHGPSLRQWRRFSKFFIISISNSLMHLYAGEISIFGHFLSSPYAEFNIAPAQIFHRVAYDGFPVL